MYFSQLWRLESPRSSGWLIQLLEEVLILQEGLHMVTILLCPHMVEEKWGRGRGERELFLFSQGHNPRGLRLQLMTSLNLKYFLKTWLPNLVILVLELQQMNYMGTQVSSQHIQKSAPKTRTHIEPSGLKTGSFPWRGWEAVLLDTKYTGKTPPQTHGPEDAAEAVVGNPYSCPPEQGTLEGAQTWQRQMMLWTRMRRSKARTSQPSAAIGYWSHKPLPTMEGLSRYIKWKGPPWWLRW